MYLRMTEPQELDLEKIKELFPNSRCEHGLLYIPICDGRLATINRDGMIEVRWPDLKAMTFHVANPARYPTNSAYSHWPCNPELVNAIEALGGKVLRPAWPEGKKP